MVITLGSFDNLKQELTTVDFSAAGTYREVGTGAHHCLSNTLTLFETGGTDYNHLIEKVLALRYLWFISVKLCIEYLA